MWILVRLIKKGNKKRNLFFFLGLLFLITFWFSFPKTLFNDPYSTVVESFSLRLMVRFLGAAGAGAFAAAAGALGLPGDRFGCAI